MISTVTRGVFRAGAVEVQRALAFFQTSSVKTFQSFFFFFFRNLTVATVAKDRYLDLL
jgi:hypothetical protein